MVRMWWGWRLLAVGSCLLFLVSPVPAQAPYPSQMIIASLGDPPNVDPILATAGEAVWRSSMVFDRLVRLNGQTLTVEPQLAQRWDVSSDGRVYTAHLRKGVTWHDGKPFTAADVEFTIYGPIEDRHYWSRCEDAIRTLPPNIQVRYAGPVEHAQVSDALVQHDVILFPTLGENYGHVIVEAMMAGCLVVLSDRTPWRNLVETGIGWDLPLEQPERFRAVLEECIAMDGAAFGEASARATAFAMRQASDPSTVEANRALFRDVIQARALQPAFTTAVPYA